MMGSAAAGGAALATDEVATVAASASPGAGFAPSHPLLVDMIDATIALAHK
jgi:hypothetical protein